ncbi:dienelactone hydrolase family protein [Alloalcanivorax mobilis]|uniref:dienelactone hydrolase family protein n=1 Tax=Alloalcanivorax mobilis TaxID=2019569 RepID=UPI000B5B2614|nr:dienelactone hydrolase family protein [Alloalcanivorax mobilis]ASK33177.1 dienelactone hydrolase [Alcanivorax sp. N3-2A]ASK36995.1 dienelactone hydrolase [Alcanivorax sp. N3-2A]|tara:strand:+ start:4977 stop:5750 length:774 start_codon:yes stop_codon:yes gene_type:complete
MRFLSLLLTGLLLSGTALADVIQRDVTLPDGLGQGVLFMDDDLDKVTAGVIVVHEWWGMNDYVRNRARMLAKEGYVAFTVDMYGNNKVANHPKDAKTFMEQALAEPELMTRRFNAAKAILRDQQYVDDARLFAVGYCFGGGVVLEQARKGNDLAGVASFHGSLGTHHRAAAGDIKARVLVATGQADPMSPPEQVSALVQELTAAGARFELLSYPGAKHGFTNPKADENGKRFDLPLAYDKEADLSSWSALLDFIGAP